MSVPTPDQVLIQAVDRLLALPQRRGAPLPEVLQGIAMVLPASALVCGASFMLLGDWLGLSIWLVTAIVVGKLAAVEVGALRSLARTWSPEAAQAMRLAALRNIEGQRGYRAYSLFWVAVGVGLLGLFTSHGLSRLHVANVASLALFGACLSFVLYARCAMPRDPDLRQAVPQST